MKDNQEKHAERVSAANESKQKEWFVYIIECSSGKLYTGMTGDLLRRWREHQHNGARFTKGDPPVCVIHVEPFSCKTDAAGRERQLKGWTRRKKRALAQGEHDLLKRL